MKTITMAPAYGSDPRVQRFTFRNDDKTPSWKRYGKGSATLEVTAHVANPYLAFVVSETSAPNSEGKGGSRREVYLTIDQDEGRTLYEWLRTLYETQAKQPKAA